MPDFIGLIYSIVILTNGDKIMSKRIVAVACVLSIFLISWMTRVSYPQNIQTGYQINLSACTGSLANSPNCGGCTTGNVPDPRPYPCPGGQVCASIQCNSGPMNKAFVCQYYSGTTLKPCMQTSQIINVNCSNCQFWFTLSPCPSVNGNCGTGKIRKCSTKYPGTVYPISAAYMCY